MNSKKTLFTVLAAFTIAGAYAQMPSTPSMPSNPSPAPVQQAANASKGGVAEKAKALLDKITSTAHITPDQAKKALPMIEEYYNKLEAGKSQQPAQAASTSSSAKEGLLGKLKGVFNAEQLEKVKGLLGDKMPKL